MNDFIINSDDESEIDNNFFNKKELYNKNNQNENDKIPCEFCDKLFDFEDLISHQVIINSLKSFIKYYLDY
jgi:hypothetical protein